MEKVKGKKSKRKGKNTGQPNALIKRVKVPEVCPKESIVPASFSDPVEPTTYELGFNDNGAAVQGTERESEQGKHLSGFIFMCNQSTKLECYQYRVFGLPLGKKIVVEKIKPGTKLFLFDFELKLLYGIYEATSTGNLNLEPAAFRGRFPAQVNFKIFKERLPLPENSLRHIIKENYTGSKFKQELSRKQVKILSSAFRPLANMSLSRAMPAPTMGRLFRHTGRLPAMEFPYLADTRHSRIPPQHVSKVNVFLHGFHHRASAYAEHVNSSSDLQSLTPASNCYVSSSLRPSFTEDPAYGVQGPSYSSYRTIEEKPPHEHVTSLGRRYRTLEGNTSHDQVTNLERRYLTVDERAPHDQVAEQYHQQLALWREALYQDNVAAYNPAAPALYNYNTQPQQVHTPYYQDSALAYTSNPAAAQYALHPDHAGVAYAPSNTTQPQAGISQAHAPVSSSYYASNQPTC